MVVCTVRTGGIEVMSTGGRVVSVVTGLTTVENVGFVLNTGVVVLQINEKQITLSSLLPLNVLYI